MNKFCFVNANKPGIYFDEENRRHINTIPNAFTELAFDSASKGRKSEARQYLQKADKMMPEQNIPYGHISPGNIHNRISMAFLQACFLAGEKELASRVMKSLTTDLQQQITCYNALNGLKAEQMVFEKKTAEELLQVIYKMKSLSVIY